MKMDISAQDCTSMCLEFIFPAAQQSPIESCTIENNYHEISRTIRRRDNSIYPGAPTRFFLSVNFQCLQIQLLPEACDLCFPRPGSLFDLSGAQPSPSQNRRHPIRPHLPSHVSLQRCVFTSGTTRAVMSWRPAVLLAMNRPKKTTVRHALGKQ